MMLDHSLSILQPFSELQYLPRDRLGGARVAPLRRWERKMDSAKQSTQFPACGNLSEKRGCGRWKGWPR